MEKLSVDEINSLLDSYRTGPAIAFFIEDDRGLREIGRLRLIPNELPGEAVTELFFDNPLEAIGFPLTDEGVAAFIEKIKLGARLLAADEAGAVEPLLYWDSVMGLAGSPQVIHFFTPMPA